MKKIWKILGGILGGLLLLVAIMIFSWGLSQEVQRVHKGISTEFRHWKQEKQQEHKLETRERELRIRLLEKQLEEARRKKPD
jgi:predicted Holliday junction resolvase-like endonuclease